MWLAAGLLLGVASRIEQGVIGFSAGISSNSGWVGLAFVAGMRGSGAGAGAGALTAATLAYYATPLGTAPGPVGPWLVLGLLAGAVFGALGRVSVRAPVPAVLPLSAVFVSEGWSGPPTDRIGLVIGLCLPLIARLVRLPTRPHAP